MDDARTPSGADDMAVDAALRSLVIDNAIHEIATGYVFPREGEAMASALRDANARGKYDALTTARALADALTRDLQDAGRDKHVRLRWRRAPLPEDGAPIAPRPIEDVRAGNFGFRRVEVLDGNIACITLDSLEDPVVAGDTAVAAMQLVAHADALILDLRANGGGAAEMVQLLCSYFFDKPVHLNDMYLRREDTTIQYWTLPHVPGRRFLGRPVRVLTSGRTFSAAEELAYDLKMLGRALVVGEKSMGGAHPGEVRRLHAHFGVFVPDSRSINPVSGTNWEGVGVEPDIAVEAGRALEAAVSSLASSTR